MYPTTKHLVHLKTVQLLVPFDVYLNRFISTS